MKAANAEKGGIMGYFLSYFMQVLFCTCVPLLALGLIGWLCRRLFVSLVGEWSGRPILIGAFALSTPLREVGHAVVAILFWHRVSDVCFLNLHDPNGELGYVEHSYNPRNPIALLGNFFYALAPLLVGLLVIFAIFTLCFGNVMHEFFAQIALLQEQGGGFADYAERAVGLIPAMLHAPAAVGLKILGFALLLLLCMGLFVTVQDLLDGFSGLLLYAALAAVCTGALMLFDARVQGMALHVLRGFATAVTALGSAVLLALGALLLIALLFRLWHLLFDKAETGNALVRYDGDK